MVLECVETLKHDRMSSGEAQSRALGYVDRIEKSKSWRAGDERIDHN